MGNIRLIGGEYYIEFEARGLKYWQKAGLDESGARSLLSQIEEKIRRGQLEMAARDIPARLFIEDYLRDTVRTHTSRTALRIQAAMDGFLKFLNSRIPEAELLSGLTPRIIEMYLFELRRPQADALRVKPGRMNLHLVVLRDFFDDAIKKGLLNDNPAGHARFVFSDKTPHPRVLSVLETERIPADGEEMALLSRFILETGLRLEEAARLTRNDIVEDTRRLRVTSGPYAREIPLTNEALDILSRLKAGERKDFFYIFGKDRQVPQTPDSLKLMMEIFAAKYGIDGLNARTLRNTFARRLCAQKIPLMRIYRLMGVSDVARVLFSLEDPRRKEKS